MRILLIRNADTDGYGGAEELVLNLASQLQLSGHNAVIATRLPLLRKRAESNGLEVIKSPWLAFQSWHGWKQALIPFYILWLVYLTVWYLFTVKRKKVDVLHPQNRDDWVAAAMAGKLASTKTIWSDHADLKHEIRNTDVWYKNWQGKIVIWASKFAENITVVSKADLKEIESSIGSQLDNKLTVAYNGVFDTNPKPVKKLKSSFVFGVTSRLLAQKGLFELLDAFTEISSKHSETELWIVGDGLDRKALEAKANKRVRFFGYVENPLDYAANFDVFVLPTHTEGFSLSLIEAAMLGLPIITTRVGGNPEIIDNEENGLLIPAKDTSALVSAMQRIYEDIDLRKKLSKNARDRFLRDFEFSHLVDTVYLPLYNNS